MKNLPEHLRNSIARRKLLQRGERVLVAVSGGLDSMALLHLLHGLAAKQGWQLFVAHFNHQLRRRASDADERFVAQVAAKLGLRCHHERGDVKGLARKRKLSLEMAARTLRHKFLAKAATHFKCDVIATAHHADDQTELFFLRLLRGTGSEGLAGMDWSSASPAAKGIRLIRPLLDVSRMDLECFIQAEKFLFREDATNASPAMLRNRIRHDLLPRLRREYQPGLNRTVPRLMAIVRDEAELVDQLARQWLAQRKRNFAELPAALQRRIVQLQLRDLEVAEDFELIESLREAPEQPITVRPNVVVQRNASGLIVRGVNARESVAKDEVEVSLADRAGQVEVGALRLRWKLKACAGPQFTSAPGVEQFDADAVGRGIRLRHWLPGDRFQPIGLKAPVKLQDWFTNRRIPRELRHRLILACTAAGEIFWVEGERIGERFKLRPETKRRLIWAWKRG